MGKKHDDDVLDRGSGEDHLDAIRKAFADFRKPEEVSVQPDLVGTHGRAWKINSAKVRARTMAENPGMEKDAGVEGWIVEAPREGERSHSYFILLAYIEDEPEELAPRCTPNATHEILVCPISPSFKRDRTLVDFEHTECFAPVYVTQVVSPGDHEKPLAVLKEMVEAISDGQIHPSDIEGFIARWGDANLNREAMPEYQDKLRAAGERYHKAAASLEAGAAVITGLEPRNGSPAMLRAGIDTTQSSMAGLVKLLMKKGLITELEYFEAVADATEQEVERYQKVSGIPSHIKLLTND